jgi:hypothetical protein
MCCKTNQLLLCKEIELVLRSEQNTKVHCVGRMQNLYIHKNGGVESNHWEALEETNNMH